MPWCPVSWAGPDDDGEHARALTSRYTGVPVGWLTGTPAKCEQGCFVSVAAATLRGMDLMNYVSIGAFLFSVTATIAAIIAARWGWLDRPQTAFRFNTSRDRTRQIPRPHQPGETSVDIVPIDHETDAFETTVKVFYEGDKVVRNVYFRPAGSMKLIPGEKEDVFRSRMVADSAPLEIQARVPDHDRQEDEPYIEIVWTTLRPCRHHGQRLHLRTNELETWQWSWWPWGIRKRPHEKWWKHRLVRTRGRWTIDRYVPLVTIPMDPRHAPRNDEKKHS